MKRRFLRRLAFWTTALVFGPIVMGILTPLPPYKNMNAVAFCKREPEARRVLCFSVMAFKTLDTLTLMETERVKLAQHLENATAIHDEAKAMELEDALKYHQSQMTSLLGEFEQLKRLGLLEKGRDTRRGI